MVQKININNGYCLRNYQWVIGVVDASGNVIHVAMNEKQIPDEFKDHKKVTLFTSYGDPF